MCPVSDLPTMSALSRRTEASILRGRDPNLINTAEAFQRFELLRENNELRKMIQSQAQQLSLNHSLDAKITHRTQQFLRQSRLGKNLDAL